MSRLAATLVALIAALFGAFSAGPAIASAVLEPLAYSYDSHHKAALLAPSTTDRGLPAKYDHAAPNDAVDRWSRGAVARPARGATLPIIAYDHPALLVQSAGAVTTTPEATPDSSELLLSFQPSDVAAKSVPNPKPVLKPNGTPDRSSPWYVSYRDADGNLQTVGNLDGVHAEVRIQQMMPGAPMSKPFGWRVRDAAKGPEWVEGTVCGGCQQYPRTLFPPGTRGAAGGPWGDG